MIGTKKSSSIKTLNKRSKTLLVISDIPVGRIIERVINTKARQLTKSTSYSDDMSSKSFHKHQQHLSKSNSARRYSDHDIFKPIENNKSTHMKTVSANSDHKKFYVPDMTKIEVKSMKGNLLEDVYQGKIIHCTWDRYEITCDVIWPSPCIVEVISDDKIAIMGMDHFCSLECCLAYHKEEENKLQVKRNSNYKNCMANIHIIVNFINDKMLAPKHKAELKPANHWKLLEGYGDGDMTINDFRMKSNIYSNTSNIKMFPISEIYECEQY